jgi:hypothetical protein
MAQEQILPSFRELEGAELSRFIGKGGKVKGSFWRLTGNLSTRRPKFSHTEDSMNILRR